MGNGAQNGIPLLPTDGDPRIKSPDEILKKLVVTKMQVLTQEVETLKRQHAAEIEQWKDYENQVNEWKKKVLEVIQDLQEKGNENEKLREEIENLKVRLQKKDAGFPTAQNKLDPPRFS